VTPAAVQESLRSPVVVKALRDAAVNRDVRDVTGNFVGAVEAAIDCVLRIAINGTRPLVASNQVVYARDDRLRLDAALRFLDLLGGIPPEPSHTNDSAADQVRHRGAERRVEGEEIVECELRARRSRRTWTSGEQPAQRGSKAISEPSRLEDA